MKIKPMYPKNVTKQPYFKGLYNGVLMGMGMILVFSNVRFTGFVVLLLSTFLYAYHTSKDYNFI